MIDSFGLSAEYLHVDDSLIKQHIVETSRRVYGKSKRQKDRLCCRPFSQTFTPKKRARFRYLPLTDGPVIEFAPMKNSFGPNSPLRKTLSVEIST